MCCGSIGNVGRHDGRGILALVQERAVVAVALGLAEGRFDPQQQRRRAVVVAAAGQRELTVMRMSKSLCSKWALSIVCRQRSMVLVATAVSTSENIDQEPLAGEAGHLDVVRRGWPPATWQSP